jgi:uncharacterized protein YndB with AHSA1/START domain
MPTARRSRTIAAPVEELWDVVSDPHHLPRWWPRVNRVEDVTLTGTGEYDVFTEVMKTAKGKLVRADFQLVRAEGDARALRWRQRVEGTPFARLLKTAETEVSLKPAAAASPSHADPPAARTARDGEAATEVTIELRQTLTGFFPRFGGYMVRRAAAATIEEALDGLERIGGRPA